MTQELLTTFETEIGGVTLVPGTGGIFEVRAGGLCSGPARPRQVPGYQGIETAVRDAVAPEKPRTFRPEAGRALARPSVHSPPSARCRMTSAVPSRLIAFRRRRIWTVDDPRLDIDVPAPDVIPAAARGKDPALVFHREAEQPELGGPRCL